MDEAMADCGIQTSLMLFIKVNGRADFDDEVVQPGWIFCFLSHNSNSDSFSRQLVFPEILGGVKSGTGSERCQEQFWRRHTFIVAEVFRRLIADDFVLPSGDFELNGPEMFYRDFQHDCLPLKIIQTGLLHGPFPASQRRVLGAAW